MQSDKSSEFPISRLSIATIAPFYNASGEAIAAIRMMTPTRDDKQVVDTDIDAENSTSWIEIGDPGPMGPPEAPKPPKPLPPIAKGPKTLRDKKINEIMSKEVAIVPGAPTGFWDGVFDMIHRTLYRKVRVTVKDGKLVIGTPKDFGLDKWVLRDKFAKCDPSKIRLTFYAIGKPYFSEPYFDADKGAGVGFDTPVKIKFGTITVWGTLFYWRLQDVGADMHIVCGEDVVTVRLGRVWSLKTALWSVENYPVRVLAAEFDSKGNLGTFKGRVTSKFKLPKTPNSQRLKRELPGSSLDKNGNPKFEKEIYHNID